MRGRRRVIIVAAIATTDSTIIIVIGGGWSDGASGTGGVALTAPTGTRITTRVSSCDVQLHSTDHGLHLPFLTTTTLLLLIITSTSCGGGILSIFATTATTTALTLVRTLGSLFGVLAVVSISIEQPPADERIVYLERDGCSEGRRE